MKIRTHDVDLFDLIVLPRYKNWLTYNTRHNSWDSSGIFYPLNVGFCELEWQEQKKATLGGKEHIFFCQEMGTARGVPT